MDHIHFVIIIFGIALGCSILVFLEKNASVPKLGSGSLALPIKLKVNRLESIVYRGVIVVCCASVSGAIYFFSLSLFALPFIVVCLFPLILFVNELTRTVQLTDLGIEYRTVSIQWEEVKAIKFRWISASIVLYGKDKAIAVRKSSENFDDFFTLCSMKLKTNLFYQMKSELNDSH